MWLLVGSDNNYAHSLAVTLSSALRSLSPHESLSVVVASNAISSHNRSRIDRVVLRARPDAQLIWADAGDFDFAGLTGNRWVTASTYLRLFVELLVPDDVQRVLYLDSDVLVCSDLAVLYHEDLYTKTLGATRDSVIANVAHPWSGISDRVEPHSSPEAPYFNAGILLIDLLRWRAKDYGPLTRAYAHSHSGEGSFDQDVLNIFFQDDWHELAMRWNVQSSLLLLHEHPVHQWVDEMRTRRSALLEAPGILHFSGSLKPWHPSSAHPFARDWRRELRTNGWFRPAEAIRWRTTFAAKQMVVRLLVACGWREARERTD